MLTDIWATAFILGDPTLARLISATMVRLSLVHGNVEESAYGYVTHAITVGPVRGDYQAAYAFGCAGARGQPPLRRLAAARQDLPAVPRARELLAPAAGAAASPMRARPAAADSKAATSCTRPTAPAPSPGRRSLATRGPGAVRARVHAERRADREAEEHRLRRFGARSSSTGRARCRAEPRGRCRCPTPRSTRTSTCAATRTTRSSRPSTPWRGCMSAACSAAPAQALQAARAAAPLVHHVPGTVWPVIYDFWNALALAASHGRGRRQRSARPGWRDCRRRRRVRDCWPRTVPRTSAARRCCWPPRSTASKAASATPSSTTSGRSSIAAGRPGCCSYQALAQRAACALPPRARRPAQPRRRCSWPRRALLCALGCGGQGGPARAQAPRAAARRNSGAARSAGADRGRRDRGTGRAPTPSTVSTCPA